MRSAAAIAIAALLVAGAATAGGSASKIVEQTLVCNVPSQPAFPDPLRTMTMSATPKRKNWSASIGAFTLGSENGEDISVGLTTGPVPRTPLGYLAWSRPPRCTGTTRSVPFSSAGLQGGPAPFGNKQYKCDVPAKVVIHVRAVFTKAVTVTSDARVPSQLFAKGNISTGQLVVATLKGKRLGYASADGATGKVNIFAAKFPTCS